MSSKTRPFEVPVTTHDGANSVSIFWTQDGPSLGSTVTLLPKAATSSKKDEWVVWGWQPQILLKKSLEISNKTWNVLKLTYPTSYPDGKIQSFPYCWTQKKLRQIGVKVNKCIFIHFSVWISDKPYPVLGLWSSQHLSWLHQQFDTGHVTHKVEFLQRIDGNCVKMRVYCTV